MRSEATYRQRLSRDCPTEKRSEYYLGKKPGDYLCKSSTIPPICCAHPCIVYVPNPLENKVRPCQWCLVISTIFSNSLIIFCQGTTDILIGDVSHLEFRSCGLIAAKSSRSSYYLMHGGNRLGEGYHAQSVFLRNMPLSACQPRVAPGLRGTHSEDIWVHTSWY